MTEEAETGYLHRNYAKSFSEHGTPIFLPNAKGWLLQRPIPNTEFYHDAMGCYPLFCCQNWNQLGQDIDRLRDEIVSLVLVTDPLAEVDESKFREWFDNVVPYKDHYVVDTAKPLSSFVNKSHRQHAERALRKVGVEVCEKPELYLDEWVRLFDILSERHGITGLRRFSRQAFKLQLSIPGMVMFRAVAEGRTVGLDLWYVQGDTAQGHLTAFDETGYKYRASYATKWTLLQYFGDRVQWINLGGGKAADASDGLSYFKQGFSTGTKPSWLCCRVFQKRVYSQLTRQLSEDGAINTVSGYFPAYRAGELT